MDVGIIKEFREFALKGNMIDMAVGIIIGGAFGALVTSLVGDVMKPPLDYLVSQVQSDPAGLRLPLGKSADGKAQFAVEYGKFIQAVLSFFIVAAAVFMLVKGINTARKRFEAQKPPAAPPGPSNEEKLLGEIRDLLRTR